MPRRPLFVRAFIAVALVLYAGALLRDRFDAWVAATDLPPVLAETSVEVRDREGRLMRAYPVADGLMRLAPPAAGGVDPRFVAMLTAYEDKRFASHSGVDPRAMIRAVGQAVSNGRAVSGGSTLTMQVARLLEDGSTGRWAGKLRQIRVALALERRLDKAAILSLYLTHAPYGGNLEGIRAATLAWFGKEPGRLTPAEAALLVALPQAPETRRPDRHPEAARAARDRVLARMLAAHIITAEEAEGASRASLPRAMRPFPMLAPHLADRARAADPLARRVDLTLDADLQARLEPLLREAAEQAGPQVSAALVVADHRSGDILASLGSAGYGDGLRQGYVDMTEALRSPGSTLKPVVYGLAFDQGLAHPETLIHDGPVMFGRYAPRNFDGLYRGDVSIRQALQMSLNIPVVKLTRDLGPARVMAALRRAGVDPQLSGGAPGLAIALGGLGVTLEDLVQLYAALAEGGQGPVLRWRAGEPMTRGARVISEVAAWQVGDILRGLTPPPGAPARVLAYKTGTSYGHRDAWAVGYDGAHVIGVWMGRADGTPVPGAFGGELAAPVLFEAFGRLKPAFDPLPPPPPATVITTTADLPQPLRRYRPRGEVVQSEGPKLTFPPDGARLAPGDGRLTLKLNGGAAPFTVLANGAPVETGVYGREFDIPAPGKGFSTLVVLDREGRSSRISVELQ